MARATVLLNVCAFFLLIGLCNCTLQSTLCAIFNPPIELYVFRRLPPNPNATVSFVYPPGFNGTAPVGVPVISVEVNPVRRTQFAAGLGDYASAFATAFASAVFRTGVLNLQSSVDLNGTISYAGIQSSGVNIPAVEEVAVTGGTGRFRGATGYIKSILLSNSGGLSVQKFEVYLCN